MKPGIYNIEIEQGANYRRVFTFPVGIDLTGAVVDMEIRQKPGGTKYWDSDNPGDEDSFDIDVEERTLTILISGETSESFNFKTAVYNLDINKDRWLKGKVILEPGTNND